MKHLRRIVLYSSWLWLSLLFLAAGQTRADVGTESTYIGGSTDPIVSMTVGYGISTATARSVFVGNRGSEIQEYWSLVTNPNAWFTSPVGTTGDPGSSFFVAVGDGDNDASNELYALGFTGGGAPLLESYTYSALPASKGWHKEESIHLQVDIQDALLDGMSNNALRIGALTSRGFKGLYFPPRDQAAYEIYKDATGWHGEKIPLPLNSNGAALAIGDGDNNLSDEL